MVARLVKVAAACAAVLWLSCVFRSDAAASGADRVDLAEHHRNALRARARRPRRRRLDLLPVSGGGAAVAEGRQLHAAGHGTDRPASPRPGHRPCRSAQRAAAAVGARHRIRSPWIAAHWRASIRRFARLARRPARLTAPRASSPTSRPDWRRCARRPRRVHRERCWSSSAGSPARSAISIAVGRGSYLNDLVTIAGGVNVLDDPRPAGVSAHLDGDGHRLDPDVIVDAGDMGETEAEHRRRQPTTERLWRQQAHVQGGAGRTPSMPSRATPSSSRVRASSRRPRRWRAGWLRPGPSSAC